MLMAGGSTLLPTSKKVAVQASLSTGLLVLCQRGSSQKRV